MASLTIGDPVAIMSRKDIKLRVRLIAEETAETIRALTSPEWNEEAKLGTLDGLCDLVYVSAGTAVSRGPWGYNTGRTLKFEGGDNAFHEWRQIVREKDDTLKRVRLAEYLAKESRTLCRIVRSFGIMPDVSSAMEINDSVNALNDLCFGVACVLKLPFDAGFMEVQNANMSKRLKSGAVFHDKGGKLRKPPGFVGPDLKYALKHGKPKKRKPFTVPTMNGTRMSDLDLLAYVKQQDWKIV